MEPVRTLIADDHPATREGVAALLNVEPEIEIVGTAGDGLEAMDKALALQAEVVVMDIKMPRMDGIEAAHCIKAKRPEVGILILSSYLYSSYLRELLSDGLLGYAYLLKSAPIDEIKRTILMVARGGLYIDPQIGNHAASSAKLDQLTIREEEVLRALARGLDNLGIAKALNMQLSTVSMHVGNIYAKLAVDTLPSLNPRVSVVLMYYGLLE
jgi:NarL family two-component system response regulator LiaR